MRNRLRAAICVLGLAVAAPAAAHHSFAMFDTSREVVLEGVVRDFQWTNPHTWLEIAVRDSSGKETDWAIEGASPNSLSRFGWKRTSIHAGDRVQAVIHPNKSGAIGGSLVKATVNGQVVGAQAAG